MDVSVVTIEELTKSNDFLNVLFNNILSGVLLLTDDCRVIMFNSSFSEAIKKTGEEILEELCGKVIGCQYPIEEGKTCGETSSCGGCVLRNSILNKMELNRFKLSRYFYISGDKTLKHFLVTIKGISHNGSNLNLVILDDITEIEQKNKELKEKLKRDGLTNLFNHSYLYKYLDKLVKKGMKFSIFMLDIDNFKRINDIYGHQTGDMVIKNLADHLNKFFKKNGIVGRYGGEEFMVILKEVSKDNAYRLAEEFRKSLPVDGVTFSGGIVESLDGLSANELVRKADKLLYVAKNKGKNRVEI